MDKVGTGISPLLSTSRPMMLRMAAQDPSIDLDEQDIPRHRHQDEQN